MLTLVLILPLMLLSLLIILQFFLFHLFRFSFDLIPLSFLDLILVILHLSFFF